MRSNRLATDEVELKKLRQQERLLEKKQREFAELPKKLERERIERERTMPPLTDLDDRKRAKAHEEAFATRGEARNLQREQNKSVLLFLMLASATAALIMWGLRIMEG